MLVYLWAFSTILLPFAGSPSTKSGDLRQAYANASSAIAAGEYELAIESLRFLTSEENSVSPIAEVAAFHLSECYLLTNQPQLAMEILNEWTQKILGSPQAVTIQPDIRRQLVELATKTCRALDMTQDSTVEVAQYLDMLTKLTNDEDDASSSLKHEIARELIRRQLRLEKFGEALEVIERYSVEPTSDNDSLDRFQIMLAWAHHDMQHNRTQAAVERLTQVLEGIALTNDQTIAARFALSEALAANKQPRDALQQLNQLASTTDIDDPNRIKATWRASVDLRRAELLFRTRRLNEAVVLLEQSKLEYPDFIRREEFDFILARCAIAEADFDKAREHLQVVVDCPSCLDEESARKAQWMIGETYFLQRKYQLAVDAYEQVISGGQQSEWRARALLQAGKCHECMGQMAIAVDKYLIILRDWSTLDKEIKTTYEEASERSKILQTQLTTSKTIRRR